ncbi:hypothetical protein Ae201684P_001345 [Aphanomyces euteiches]|nr:hypothetical protein Ae201684P_001345 [Aphanomyces euteiches]
MPTTTTPTTTTHTTRHLHVTTLAPLTNTSNVSITPSPVDDYTTTTKPHRPPQRHLPTTPSPCHPTRQQHHDGVSTRLPSTSSPVDTTTMPTTTTPTTTTHTTTTPPDVTTLAIDHTSNVSITPSPVDDYTDNNQTTPSTTTPSPTDNTITMPPDTTATPTTASPPDTTAPPSSPVDTTTMPTTTTHYRRHYLQTSPHSLH